MNFFKKTHQNSQSEREKKQGFYESTHDWMYDVYYSQSVWLKRTLVAFVIVSICLVLSLLIILGLTPLKKDVPFLYTFNNATGEVTKIGRLEPTELTGNWEMTRFFLIHYVMNRESYDYDDIDHPYQLAWAMTDSSIVQTYEQSVSSNNESSPYSIYGKDKYVTVNVIAVNKLNDNTADVRFEKILHNKNQSDSEQKIECEAIIKWKYEKTEASQKMLDRDPLGFKVTYYQVSQVNLPNS